MNSESERFHLHFRIDGAVLVRREKDAIEKHFSSLLEALTFAYALSGNRDIRLKVYDSQGREVVETLV